MLGPGSIFLSEGRWLVRADLLLKTPACKHWGCCTLLSLVLREHLSSPPCCATVPPASWGKMSPLVTPHPSVSSAHAMGACCCTELASGEMLVLCIQPSNQEAQARFLGQAAHMASLLLAAPRGCPVGCTLLHVSCWFDVSLIHSRW